MVWHGVLPVFVRWDEATPRFWSDDTGLHLIWPRLLFHLCRITNLSEMWMMLDREQRDLTRLDDPFVVDAAQHASYLGP